MAEEAAAPGPRRSTRVKKPPVKLEETVAKMAAPTTANTSKKRKATAPATNPAKKAKTAAPVAKTAPKASKKAATTSKATKAKATTKTAAAKKDATSKTSTAKKAATGTKKTASTATKRKAGDDGEEENKPPKKKASPAPKPVKKVAPKKIINEAPSVKLNVFVFGEGSSGELGLGSKGNITDVKRPRLNKLLEDVGVVQVAVGGMHCAALTFDNRIFTWGVNDQGTLGRVTKHADVLVRMKEIGVDSDSEDEDEDRLNPLESTPAPMSFENVPEGTIFTSVAASDSCTFAITDDGLVYGCGTFRSNEGILGFGNGILIQTTLTRIPDLKNIVKIACGTNHALALDKVGNVVAWGAGQQNQLGRRVVERTRLNGLNPRQFGLPRNKVTDIFAGAYHSFAITTDSKVYSWGLNSFGETGCADDVGEDEAVVLKPAEVKTLTGKNVVQVVGGSHHSIALTKDGELLGWGRVDGDQLGLDLRSLPEDLVVKDDYGKIRICSQPTHIPNIPQEVIAVTSGPDHAIAITKTGRAYAWGFSVNYQTGLGTTDDIKQATLIDNTATREEKLIWAGAGGQFGVVTSESKKQ